MKKKKILHITQAMGGVKTYLEHLFKFADLDRFEFVIIAPADEAFQELCREKSIRYHVLTLQRSISPVQDITGLIKMVKLIKREKPDVIHTHSAKGGFLGRLAAKFCKSKVIYTPHGFSYMSFTGFKRILFYALEMFAKNWATLLLAVSYSEANRAIFEVGIKSSKVKVILNAIPIPFRRSFREEGAGLRIGMIGRLTYQKNPLLFLEIAAALLKTYPNIKFSILGAGLHDHLTKEIDGFILENKLKGKVELLQWGDQDTSSNFLKSTDIFVMTSVFEGLPFSLLEAMANRIPCVVSKVDGNTDVIQNNENGYSCLSVEEFYNKIDQLIRNEQLRIRIGAASCAYVERFHDIKKNIISLEIIYENLIASRSIPQIKYRAKSA